VVGDGKVTVGGNNVVPKPSPTPKDLENELTCGDADREEAAAVAISQAIATTGRAGLHMNACWQLNLQRVTHKETVQHSWRR
jgi:hypothetical protein